MSFVTSVIGTFRTWPVRQAMSVIEGEADLAVEPTGLTQRRYWLCTARQRF